MLDGTKPIRMPSVAGDRERLQRTKRVLERDIYRLERGLARRQSPEGQEATRAVILSKRAQVHRLHDAMYQTVPYRPIPKEKARRTSTPQYKTPPKGSALNRARMERARQNLNKKAAPPKRINLRVKRVPKVNDVQSAQKAKDVINANKKAIHEAKMLAENQARLERERKEREQKRVKEVASVKPLSPSEQNNLKMLQKQYYKMAPILARVSNMTPDKDGIVLYDGHRITREMLWDAKSKLHSIKYQITFLRNKQRGIDTKPMQELKRPKPKKSSGYMQRQAREGADDIARQRVQDAKRLAENSARISRGRLNPHRPYAMNRGMGMLTVQKHRQAQRLNPTAVESNNMAGLRRYTAAQYARDQRVRAEQNATKEVANLAGAFSHTRAAMERMVR